MMKLAEKYGDRPVEEFPMLFQRIIEHDPGLLPPNQGPFSLDNASVIIFVGRG